MSLLEVDTWSDSLFTGSWHRGHGESAPVIEPATGAELGRYSLATPEDVDEAVARAKDAQREWARTPLDERAAILRRAGAEANIEAFTEAQWVTLAGEIPQYPF
jgi:benzaldehyde dehydrogenase (NAD)